MRALGLLRSVCLDVHGVNESAWLTNSKVVIGGFSLVLHASCMCSARAEHCVFERQSICSAALVLHIFFPLFLLFFSCLKFGSYLLSAIVSVGDQPTLLDKTNRNLRPPLPQCQ